jgi:hypothetical protein
MPLIKCPACETEISSEAKSCPKCGHRLIKPRSKIDATLAIIFGIGAIGFGTRTCILFPMDLLGIGLILAIYGILILVKLE